MARTIVERLAMYQEALDLAEDRLVEALTSPKPTYTLDGQTFEWNEWIKMLRDSIKDLNALITALDRPAGGGLTMTQVFSGS